MEALLICDRVLAKGKGAYACQLIYVKKIVMEGVGTTGVD